MMGRPEDPGHSTEPMPPTGGRRSTEPLTASESRSTVGLPAGHRPAPDARDRRLWLIAGVLALILAFGAGFLVGRGQGEEPGETPGQKQADGQGPIKKQVCAKAVKAGQKTVTIQERAVASLGALVRATAEGDDSLMVALNAELQRLSGRFEKVNERAEGLAERCGL
jgi:hypothetical protein